MLASTTPATVVTVRNARAAVPRPPKLQPSLTTTTTSSIGIGMARDNEDTGRPDAVRESLAIPGDIRAAVDDRDALHCRVCGRYLGDDRAQHHILYGGDLRGMGGRRHHALEEILTVCWMYGGNCHDIVHGNKSFWVPVLLRVAQRPGITALQVIRWDKARERKRRK